MAKLKGLFDHEDSSGVQRKAGRIYDEPDEPTVFMRLRSGVCVRVHESSTSHSGSHVETKTLAVEDPPPIEVKVLVDDPAIVTETGGA